VETSTDVQCVRKDHSEWVKKCVDCDARVLMLEGLARRLLKQMKRNDALVCSKWKRLIGEVVSLVWVYVSDNFMFWPTTTWSVLGKRTLVTVWVKVSGADQ